MSKLLRLFAAAHLAAMPLDMRFCLTSSKWLRYRSTDTRHPLGAQVPEDLQQLPGPRSHDLAGQPIHGPDQTPAALASKMVLVGVFSPLEKYESDGPIIPN